MAAREEVNVIESWEDIEESGILDKKLLQSESLSQEEPEIMSQGMVSGPIILRDDSFGPQEPTVKILKRPQRTINGHSDSPILNGDLKPRQPVKTLQQREQEYAEARLRILGEARSPEEQLQAVTNDRISKIQQKMELLRTSENTNIIRLPKGPDGTKGFNVRR
uniref:SUZ RNA-binding domain-containing n=3 Tax=Timema TaxID=61471 RepID=A0A7R9AMF7_TIMSH|nr:unnamed protein product [Timema douglasi]CAD7257103.1 unnamed protein product [Timema shepardi]CAD7399546.1 unnamed protein product [Timema cristinae]